MRSLNDVLVFAGAALAVASGSMTFFGLRRRRYAGWLWWLWALWLATAGTLMSVLWPGPLGSALAAPLLIQWPLLTLIGLRRFQPRQTWPGSETFDVLLLTLVAIGAAWGGLRLDPQGALQITLCGIAAQLYAAIVLFKAPSGRDAVPVQGLALVMALAALGPALASLPGGDPQWPLDARAAAAALGAIVLASVAQTLVCERSERHLRDSRRRLRDLANLDALTRVPNRRHFSHLAEQALAQDPPGSDMVLLFDVDHFKQINDEFGHAAGDRALCLVSGCMRDQLRAADVAGRHGGDEFVLLLRRAGHHDALAVAARIVAEVQRRSAEQQLPPLSLSFGLAQVRPGQLLDAAIRRADQALYEAKRQGRSRAVAALGEEDRPLFGKCQRLGLTGP